MTTRQYSSRSQQSTLTAAITSGASSITVVSGSGLLGGVTIPSGRTFTLVIDPDTAIEEIVDATAVSTNTFTITRAIDGSSAQEHSAGAVVRHMAIGRDYRDANLHAEADASYNDGSGSAHSLHGIASGEGVVVGTLKTQTLTNKTLTLPKINDGADVTANSGEINILDGATITTAELNILDGATLSTAELNILDGVTATTAEINILAGATLSTTELNYVDGVTSAIQSQIDSKASLSGATFTGSVEIDQDLTIDGNLTVNGTTFSASSTSIVIEDNMVQLAHNNAANTVDRLS